MPCPSGSTFTTFLRCDGRFYTLLDRAPAAFVPVRYRRPELLAAASSVLAFIVEGEKDTDRLVQAGLAATCNVGGAGKWKPEYSVYLRGRRVVVIADRDGPEKKYAGRRHARAVCASLGGIATEVKYLELPGERVKDATDWFEAGGTCEQLMELLAQVAPVDPALAQEREAEFIVTDAADDERVEAPSAAWPDPLADDAYYGLAGKAIRAVDAVEKLPSLPTDPAQSAKATGTDGREVATVGRSESVSSPLASIGDCTAVMGNNAETIRPSLTLITGGNRHEKTPSGRDGANKRVKGVEPSTFTLAT